MCLNTQLPLPPLLAQVITSGAEKHRVEGVGGVVGVGVGAGEAPDNVVGGVQKKRCRRTKKSLSPQTHLQRKSVLQISVAIR